MAEVGYQPVRHSAPSPFALCHFSALCVVRSCYFVTVGGSWRRHGEGHNRLADKRFTILACVSHDQDNPLSASGAILDFHTLEEVGSVV